MKDYQSMHLKLQEMCDCFATADPLREMAALSQEPDKEQGALKLLALAILHGINANAKKIYISKDEDGDVRVTAKYRVSELPSPGPGFADKIIEAARDITHIDKGEGKTPLAVGILDSSIELKVELDEKGGCSTVEIKFPE